MRRAVLVGALLLAVLAGCTGAGGNAAEARARVVDDGARCGTTEPGVTWLDRERGHVRVSLGERPTSGYALALADEPLRVTDDTVRLRVRERRPPADAMLLQVLTQPCLDVAVSNLGARALRVETTAGHRLGELRP